MYKLLLVDDEPDILRGMAKGIHWNEWGFEVIGQAKNGLEALEIIKNNKPHVVLSDIRMPQMDGVELMKYLNQNYPEVKIIISSGYNDVEYLKVAIKNSVTEYLLKPTDLDEFETVFLQMKEKLDEEQRQKNELESLKESIAQNRDYHYSKILNDLSEGYVREEDYKKIISEIGLNFNNCVVAILDMHNSKQDSNEVDNQFKVRSDIIRYCNLREECFKVYFFVNVAGQIVGIISLGESNEDWKTFVIKYLQELQSEIYDLYEVEVCAGVSDRCLQVSRLPHALSQAENSLCQKMFLGTLSILLYPDLQAFSDANYYLNNFNQEKVKNLIIEGDFKRIQEELDNVFTQFENKIVKDPRYIDQICLECLYNISRWVLTHYNISLEQMRVEEGVQYFDIHNLPSLKEKQDFMEQNLMRVLNIIKSTEDVDKKVNNLAQVIKKYVDEEYTSNLISLDFVAQKVKKNAGYLSKLFKRETGYNFSDYITQKRLELGKELLRDPSLKIYEIAEQIGYADVSNFIKVFKKNCGVSPNEYRNMQGRV